MSWEDLAREHWGMLDLAEVQGVTPDEAVPCSACVFILREAELQHTHHTCGQ